MANTPRSLGASPGRKTTLELQAVHMPIGRQIASDVLWITLRGSGVRPACLCWSNPDQPRDRSIERRECSGAGRGRCIGNPLRAVPPTPATRMPVPPVAVVVEHLRLTRRCRSCLGRALRQVSRSAWGCPTGGPGAGSSPRRGRGRRLTCRRCCAWGRGRTPGGRRRCRCGPAGRSNLRRGRGGSWRLRHRPSRRRRRTRSARTYTARGSRSVGRENRTGRRRGSRGGRRRGRTFATRQATLERVGSRSSGIGRGFARRVELGCQLIGCVLVSVGCCLASRVGLSCHLVGCPVASRNGFLRGRIGLGAQFRLGGLRFGQLLFQVCVGSRASAATRQGCDEDKVERQCDPRLTTYHHCRVSRARSA